MHLATIVLAVLAGLLGGAVAAAVYHRRQVDEIRSLIQRLEELSQGAPPASLKRQRDLAVPGGVADGESSSSLRLITADVLAGRTSHIEELVESRTVQGLPLADQAIVQIYAKLGEPLSPSTLAASLNVSLRSLERGLSLALQCSPRELILAVKMREARRLLETGELNVTGVAYRLGFSSPSHFSRRFREFFKRSPSEVARSVA